MRKDSNKIIVIFLIIWILSGIIVAVVAGPKKDITYQSSTRIEVYIPQGYQKENILSIAKESFPNRIVAFEEIEKLEQVAGIRMQTYTEEELNTQKEKISQTYNIEKDALELEEVKLPEVQMMTLIQPYIAPLLWITAVSCIYVFFRNWKSENKWKIIGKTVLTTFAVPAAYFSLLLIVRIPIGNYTMPIAFAIYSITLLCSIAYFPKEKNDKTV